MDSTLFRLLEVATLVRATKICCGDRSIYSEHYNPLLQSAEACGPRATFETALMSPLEPVSCGKSFQYARVFIELDYKVLSSARETGRPGAEFEFGNNLPGDDIEPFANLRGIMRTSNCYRRRLHSTIRMFQTLCSDILADATHSSLSS